MNTLRCLLVGLIALGFGVDAAQAQSPAADTTAQPRVVTGSRVTGGSAAGASGLARIRQRIAQIRGQQAAPGRAPIIVTMPQMQAMPPASAVPAPRATQPPTNSPAQQNQPANPVTRADLNRMEVRLMRRIERLFNELYAQQRNSGSQRTIIAPQGQAAAPSTTPPLYPQRALPGSRSAVAPEDPATAAPDSVQRPPAPQPAPTPTVVEVQRALLETGLFRALDVNFETGKATLTPRAERSLAAIGEALDQYATLRVEVAGFTDATGPASFNEQLAQRRATAVRDYLVSNFGIAQERLAVRGYGEEQPIASNDSPTGRALNRRVEFRVLNPDAAERIEVPSADSARRAQMEDAIRNAVREGMQGAAPDTTEQ